MTPVGHSLTGLTILAAVAPPNWGLKKLIPAAGAFVVLANAPDLPVPGWGHDRYDISHSVFCTSLGVLVLWALYRGFCRISKADKLPRRIVAGAGAAWFSHLLLDSFYNHGLGVAVMWPFGNGRLNFPFPWFETLRMPIDYASAHSLGVFRIEACFYGAILAVVCLIRWRIASR